MRTGEGESPGRKIVHIDMDAFFASVEQRDDPSLRGRPVAVGWNAPRSVVAAASYEARKFGVRSAMPSLRAAALCRSLVFVPPRFDAYRAVSMQIRAIFEEFSPLVEPLSLDEAYLDVTHNLKGLPFATEVASEIRARIFAETGLTASAGVSYNKWLAKMASDVRKPNGMFVIRPERGQAFVDTLAIGKFHGVGPATAEKMKLLGISTGADLREKGLAFLVEHFGKAGGYFYGIARGIDERPVEPDRETKSIGAETTFDSDVPTWFGLRPTLASLAEKVMSRCQRQGLFGRTLTVKVKDADFRQSTRAATGKKAIDAASEMASLAEALLPHFGEERMVRLVGLSVSAFREEADRQMSFEL